MKYHTSLITAALFAALFTACSKRPQDAAAVHPKAPDLGVVEVSDGIESRHDLGGGRVCVIKPTVKKGGSVLLAILIQETDSAGATRTLAHLNAITFPDHAVEVETGDLGVRVTPHIKQ